MDDDFTAGYALGFQAGSADPPVRARSVPDKSQAASNDVSGHMMPSATGQCARCTTVVPAWVREVLDSFAGISGRSHGRLTAVESDLFDAVWLLLRARFDQTELPEPKDNARSLIRSALAALDAETARS